MQQRVLFAPRPPSPPGPDVAGDLPRYRAWLAERERARSRVDPRTIPHGDRKLDLLLVLDGPDRGDGPRTGALRQCLRAVRAQTTHDWHLTVVHGDDADPEVRSALHQELAGVEDQVSVIDVAGAAGVAGAATAGAAGAGAPMAGAAGAPIAGAAGAQLAFERSSSPVVVLLGQDDVLAQDAVALLLFATAEADVAYADEDALDGDGRPSVPVLKPDWSPELLLSGPYLGRPVAACRELVSAAGGFRAIDDGDWEHDFMLRVTERASAVAHVAEVLCHRRGASSAAGAAGPGAVDAALARRGEAGTVEPGRAAGMWRVRRRSPRPGTIAAIIPFRDSPRFLRTCVDSMTASTGGLPLRLVLVDNGSVEPETLSLLERLQTREDVTVLHDPRPFNWAALNNAAAAATEADTLLFLNDDVEAPSAGWLEALVAQAERPDVAAVGARLLYPSGPVQHAGMVLGLGGAAGHVLAGLAPEDPGYLGLAVRCREVAAVTGACLATRRAVFEQLGGFDEALGLDLNDVDYCLRARGLGYRVLYEPGAQLVHHESPSRGTSGSADNIRRFVERWSRALSDGDPYLSPHLTRISSSCSLAGPDEEERWQRWRATLPTS